jgi:hypothetical protein
VVHGMVLWELLGVLKEVQQTWTKNQAD